MTAKVRFAGVLPFDGMARVFDRGYAVAGTDDGHESATMTDGDGIVAGAPFASAVRTLTGGAVRLTGLNGAAATLSAAQLQALQTRALDSCGGQAGYLADPCACRVDLAPLQCQEGGGSDCLTAQQVDLVRAIYAEHRDPASGAPLYG